MSALPKLLIFWVQIEIPTLKPYDPLERVDKSAQPKMTNPRDSGYLNSL